MSASRYTFVDYSPDWSAAFAREADTLRALLGDVFVDVRHIGSTSVPGLAAKPIIDGIPLVTSLEALDARTELLVHAGYRAWGEYGLERRRFFTKDAGAWRTHNLHVYRVGDPSVERHVAFAAYLRAHDDVREEYAAVKRSAFAQHPSDVDAYNDAKNDWIKRVEPLAVAWARARDVQMRTLVSPDVASPISPASN